VMDILNKMPQGWIQTKLGEISSINPKLALEHFPDDLEISFIPMASVETESGRVDLTQTRKLGSVKKGYTPFIDGDVIFAKITPCMENGKIAFLNGLKEGIGFGSTEFHVSRPLNKISNKYIFYFLVQRSYRKDAQGNMTGSAGQLRVPTTFFRDSVISLPPHREQHRIVAKIEELFSELDKGVEALKTAQQQLKVYRQAVLKWAFEGKLTEEWREQQKNLPTALQLLEQIKTKREKQAKATGKKLKPLTPLTKVELFGLPSLPSGWLWMQLTEVSTDVFDGPFGSHLKSSDYTDKGIRVIRLENIGSLEFKDQYKSYVAKEKYETIKKHTVYSGDIVFSSFISEKIRVSIVPPYIREAINKADCFCIRTNKSIIGENYLSCFLSTRTAYHQLVNEIHGATRPRINTTQLKQCFIPYCSVKEQHVIAAEIETRLSVADKLEETISQSLQQAEALRQSILKKAFEGKLVPQDPNDEPATKLLERIRAEKAGQTQEKKTRKKKATT